MDILSTYVYYYGQMNLPDTTIVLERQLLLQLGDRLKRLRKSQGLGTVETARRAGISRTTLGSVEAGDPGPSIGTYLRVMSVLGVSDELACWQAMIAPRALTNSGSALRRGVRRGCDGLADESRHQIQDLQSLALHEEAFRLIRANPELLLEARNTLDRWLASGNSRSRGLWQEWQEILRHAKWRKVRGRTRRAQELRQASPLTAVLPDKVRQSVLDQIGELRKGVVLGTPGTQAPA